MMIFYNATIECDKDTAAVYEHILGEDGPKLEFPLGGVTVKHFGGRAELMIQVDPAKAGVVIDRLRAAEPQQATVKGKTVYQLSGSSEHLHMTGVDAEHGQVAFTLTEWSAGQGSVAE